MSAKYLLQVFSKHYREKIGETYPPTWGRDQKIFNDLLKTYDVDRLESLLDRYFERQQNIYSIPFFKAALGDLIQIDKRDAKPRSIEDNESWRFKGD